MGAGKGWPDQGPLPAAGQERRPGRCGSGGGDAKEQDSREEQKPQTELRSPALVDLRQASPRQRTWPWGLEASTEETVEVPANEYESINDGMSVQAQHCLLFFHTGA